MIKYFCDRCGANVNGPWALVTVTSETPRNFRYEQERAKEVRALAVALCIDCHLQLQRWIAPPEAAS